HAQFPAPLSRALERSIQEVEDRAPRRRIAAAREQIRDVDAVDGIWRGLRAANGRNRRHEVEIRTPGIHDFPRGNCPRPARDERNPRAALVGGVLPPAQQAGAALIPRAVIAGEDHDRIFVELMALYGSENLSGAPIDFLDGIAVRAVIRFAGKFCRSLRGIVRIRVCEPQEEWMACGRIDEFDGFLRVARSKKFAIRVRLDRLQVAY